MKKINRLLINICSEKLPESKDFYTKLFDFKVDYDSDWFIHLISEEKNLELGIIARDHEIVPAGFQKNPEGFYATFVVENVDETFEIAKRENFTVVESPQDTFYGQRRLLLQDPNGALVDISAPIENFQF